MPLINLPNGVKAVFYGPRSLGNERILALCKAKQKRLLDNTTYLADIWNDENENYCILKVGLGYELVFLVLAVYPADAKHVIKILNQHGLADLLDNTTYVVYRGTAYLWSEGTGQILLSSIKTGVPPAVCALVYCKGGSG